MFAQILFLSRDSSVAKIQVSDKVNIRIVKFAEKLPEIISIALVAKLRTKL